MGGALFLLVASNALLSKAQAELKKELIELKMHVETREARLGKALDARLDAIGEQATSVASSAAKATLTAALEGVSRADAPFCAPSVPTSIVSAVVDGNPNHKNGRRAQLH